MMNCFVHALVVLGLFAQASCAKTTAQPIQGYVEGEYVYVAPAIAGRLDRLLVKRGDAISKGAALFALESQSEAADERQADERLKAAQAKLKDLLRGKRPQELNVTRAQLAQARAEAERAAANHARDLELFKAHVIAQAQLDNSQANALETKARVAQLESELDVGHLPGRAEAVQAQSAEVAAALAALDLTRWRIGQKTVAAPSEARVVDTLYREGEWVAAGSSVVKLLPPKNVKIRFFVAENTLGRINVNQTIHVQCDGCAQKVAAIVTYISNESEYTPPIIYSNDTRAKLVYMIEAHPAPGDAAHLHPGQPVEVALR